MGIEKGEAKANASCHGWIAAQSCDALAEVGQGCWLRHGSPHGPALSPTENVRAHQKRPPAAFRPRLISTLVAPVVAVILASSSLAFWHPRFSEASLKNCAASTLRNDMAGLQRPHGHVFLYFCTVQSWLARACNREGNRLGSHTVHIGSPDFVFAIRRARAAFRRNLFCVALQLLMISRSWA
eukprot:395-Pyramimonas_sp.AAC.3